MKKRLLLCLYLLCTCLGHLTAQNTKDIDSLVNVLSTQTLSSDGKFDIYVKLCQIYVDSDIDKLVEYAEEGLALAKKEKNDVRASKFYEYLGRAYCTFGDYDKSLDYLTKALDLALDAGDIVQESAVYRITAWLYSYQGIYDTALEYYMKALPLLEKTGDKRNYVASLSHIGGIHGTLGNFERESYYLEQAKGMLDEVNEPALNMSVYYNLGDSYHRQGEFEKAIEYSLIALEISQSIGNKRFESAINQSLATIYMRTEDFVNAEKYANEGLRLAEELGDQMGVLASWITLSNLYRDQERWAACDAYAQKVWYVDSTDMDMGMNVPYNIVLSNIMMGNKEIAVRFLRAHSRAVDIFLDRSYHEKLMDMEVKYETEKKELQIAILKQERKLYIWLSIGGAAVLLLALGLLFYRHRLNKQKLKQLEQEKQLVATQAILDGETAERTRLARDLHDGLGGMLSVVKLNLKDMKNYSILDASDTERFGKALEMLDGSITELRRVAHHMMPESLMRNGLKVSLEDFCHAIPNAHFHYFGRDRRLDDPLEVMLYRCAYELVNNALKYADAQNINVQLVIEDNLVSLTVQDDGKGFDPAKVTTGSGLSNIRTRVSAYNGKMMLHSSPGKGTEVSIEIESKQIN